MQWDWYAAREGYLCGGGQHFVSHEDVEVMLKTGREPRIEHVNTYGHPTLRQVTPPPGGGNGSGEEPAFWSTEFRRSVGMPPLNSTIEIREGGGRSAGFGGVGLGGMYGLGGAYEAMYGRMGSGFRRRRGFP